MKISVIIPTYNRAEFISKAIESVLEQSYKADEIIIIDDGSNDNTKEIVKNYPVKYIYQENKGVSSARNKGIKKAKNEWVCFLDSDDIWEIQKLEKQVFFHKQNPHILFSHTDEKWLFNGKEIRQKPYQQKQNKLTFLDHTQNTFIGCSTVFIHKKIFDTLGMFDESLTACEDYDLWLRILREYELSFIDEKLIQKIAGHKNQLSFDTPLQDQYRIKSLLKHIDSPYSKEIKKEIVKRCEILIKGALKHGNKEVELYYSKLQLELTS